MSGQHNYDDWKQQADGVPRKLAAKMKRLSTVVEVNLDTGGKGSERVCRAPTLHCDRKGVVEIAAIQIFNHLLLLYREPVWRGTKQPQHPVALVVYCSLS